MKRIVWGIVILCVVATVAYSVKPRRTPVEMGTPERRNVREYIAEEAKTRLADEYVVDMPVQGTLLRIDLEVGDMVEAGQVVARVDDFDLKQQLLGVDYMIEQAQALSLIHI